MTTRRVADETAGVAAVARLLVRLAEPRPGGTVSALSAELGISRSTAFAVAAELEAAGLVERDAKGLLAPGPGSGRFGLARFGFGALAGPAEALLPLLRDDTDASISLLLRDGDRETVVASRRASWDTGADALSGWIEAEIGRSAGGTACRLRLGLRPHAEDAERRSAAACLERVARTLAAALASRPL